MIAAPQGKGVRLLVVAEIALLLSSIVSGLAFAQTGGGPSSASKVDSYTPDQLMEKAKPLRLTAEQSGSGSASVTLEKYPGHYTMLAFRERSGGAELHEEYADVLVILDGMCTLIVGGSIPDAKTTGPGEVRGSSIAGGESRGLHKGDIVHIPAKTPHQMQLPAGGTLTYFVIKALEAGNHE